MWLRHSSGSGCSGFGTGGRDDSKSTLQEHGAARHRRGLPRVRDELQHSRCRCLLVYAAPLCNLQPILASRQAVSCNVCVDLELVPMTVSRVWSALKRTLSALRASPRLSGAALDSREITLEVMARLLCVYARGACFRPSSELGQCFNRGCRWPAVTAFCSWPTLTSPDSWSECLSACMGVSACVCASVCARGFPVRHETEGDAHTSAG